MYEASSADSASSIHGANLHGTSSSKVVNKGYQTDTLNPYFMHPNENSALILVTPLLSPNNYHSWSRSMTMASRSKNKLHFINGVLPRRMDEEVNSLAWDRCNTMIMSWLHNSVESEFAQSILWMETAEEIWNELKARFYQGDVLRISDIQEEIYNLKQGDASIASYFTKLKKLWKELDNFRLIPECLYDSTCLAITKIRAYHDGNQVIRFLKGLNEKYSAVRSQIMLMEPLPNLCRVYSLLVQQERQAGISIDESKLLACPNANSTTNNTHQSSSANNSSRGRGRDGRSYGGRGRGSRICTHCGMTNHTIDTCFKKHGYPPHWKQESSINLAQFELQDASQIESHGDKDPTQATLKFTLAQHKALLDWICCKEHLYLKLMI
ncbi:uncharacterized protein LOC131632879 [Vicia villosa]|uniref:uncharacterized protein LOC131632879 n=1 Tax=Vicia villosa TaxID=3911 RepID=UPI00273CCA17|nr:uncharacterized protein LOC131632879 [Vicia villosa]